MRGSILSAGTLIALAAMATRCCANVEYYPGGYCTIVYNYDPNVPLTHYSFDPDTGRLDLLREGNWWVRYQAMGGGWDDIPRVRNAVVMNGSQFRLVLFGKDLKETCDFSSVNTTLNRVELVLQDGGSLLAGKTFLAPNSDMENSRFEGNLAGTLRVKSIRHGTLQTDLRIQGNVTGLCDVESIASNATLRIDGSLAAGGRVEVDGDLTGTLQFGSSINGTLRIPRDLNVALYVPGNVGGLIDIGRRNNQSIHVGGSVSGDVNIASTMNARIDIDGALSGDIDIASHCYSTIDIDGALSGRVHVASSITTSGNVFVAGRHSGVIDVGSDVVGDIHLSWAGDNTGDVIVGNDLTGELTVHGDLSGEVEIGQDLTGRIHVNGSLLDGVTGPEIRVVGTLGPAGAIAIDYDGWDVDDIWASGATVEVDGTPYSENEPAEFIWEISNCLADMNNNWVVESPYRAFSIHV